VTGVQTCAIPISSVPPFQFLALKYVIIISKKRNYHFQGYAREMRDCVCIQDCLDWCVKLFKIGAFEMLICFSVCL
jgi:hypothetical protein